MINVTDNYKLVNMEIDGEERTERLDAKPWNVMESEFEDEMTTIQEGNQIRFVVESGEIIEGTLNKISGSKEKTKLQINPFGKEYETIWSVVSIKEGTLKVIENKENN
jgi:hypothetical protein